MIFVLILSVVVMLPPSVYFNWKRNIYYSKLIFVVFNAHDIILIKKKRKTFDCTYNVDIDGTGLCYDW